MQEVFLSDLITERRERAGGDKLPVLSVSTHLGLVEPGGLFNKTIASKDTKNYKKVFFGDFAYNPSRINIGSIAMNEFDRVGIVSPMYTVFSVKDQNIVDPKYLFNFLRSPRGRELINHNTQGGVRFQLKISSLERMKIPLPDLKEQKRMVDILGEAEALKRKREIIDQKLDELIPALFIKICGDPATNPHNFPIKKVGELLLACDYGTSKKPSVSEVGTVILRMGNLSNKGVFDLSDLKYVKLSEKEISKLLLKEGDVLF